LYTLALIGSGPLNSLIAGLLGSALGAPLAIAMSGAVMGLGLVLVALRNREVFDLEMPPTLATAPASH
ncbi:MAG: hypothetical protein ACRDFA_09400, partial [bacterium]